MKPLITPEMAKELLAMQPDKREMVLSTVATMLARMVKRHVSQREVTDTLKGQSK